MHFIFSLLFFLNFVGFGTPSQAQTLVNPVKKMKYARLMIKDKKYLKSATALIQKPFLNSNEIVGKFESVGKKLRLNRDGRGLFAEIYAVTMKGVFYYLDNKKFSNPDWVENLLVNFANIYRLILLNELNDNTAAIPDSWKKVFAAEKDFKIRLSSEMMAATRVHITRDLVYALIESNTDFKSETVLADYLLIAKALKRQTPEIWKVLKSYGPVREILPLKWEEAILVKGAIFWRKNSWSRAEFISEESDLEKRKILLNYLEKYTADRVREITLLGEVIR